MAEGGKYIRDKKGGPRKLVERTQPKPRKDASKAEAEPKDEGKAK